MSAPEFISSTVGQISAELARRGAKPDQRVTVALEFDEPQDWISMARAFARSQVQAEGWADADVDTIIREERTALQRSGE